VRRRLLLLALAAALTLVAAPPAAADTGPNVSARAYLVANGRSGAVLLAENGEARLAVASITKLMTALVALEHAKPGDTVTVGPIAASVGESTINLQPGEQIPLRDLLAALLIQSANDAAYAVAAHVGEGDVAAFVRLMNAKARELGLRRTTFVRPDGLDAPGHVSSARDVLRLARAAMERPLVRSLVRQRAARIAGGRKLFGWNDLLGSFAGLVGVKTGHTAKAGWCQVAAARRDGVVVYAVVLGSPTRARRNADLAKLLEWGFAQYARVPLVEERQTYATAGIPFSEERLELVAAEPAEAIVRVGRPLVEEVVAPAVVALPLRRGERVGEVRVRSGKRVLARRPLVAAADVPEPSLGTRAGWYVERALGEAGGIVSDVIAAIA
jgi:serine-type D-Ala-D-Ala carboxypeptidase (penicillin-binding protein 5/6)